MLAYAYTANESVLMSLQEFFILLARFEFHALQQWKIEAVKSLGSERLMEPARKNETATYANTHLCLF